MANTKKSNTLTIESSPEGVLDSLPTTTNDELFGNSGAKASSKPANVPVISEEEEVARLAQGASGINLSPEDQSTPRLQLLQSLSPQVSDGDSKAGEFINSATNVNYGSTVDFHVLYNYKTRLKWDIVSSSVDCSSPDGITGTTYGKCALCQFSKWGKDKQAPPACDELKSVIMYLPEDDSIVLFSGKKTGFKPVKQLLLDIANSDTKAFYGRYELSSEKVTQQKKSWFIPSFKLVGHINTVADFRKLESLANQARESQRKFTVNQLALGDGAINEAVDKSGEEISEY